MTTAADVRDHIKSDLSINGADYDAQILNAIHSALRQYRGKRFWFLEKTGTVTLLDTTSSAALPNDYSAPGEFEMSYNGRWLSDGKGFDYLAFSRLKRDYWLSDPLETSVPRACAVLNRTLHVSCLANADFTIALTYYCQDATLPAAAGTSVWFDDGYDAIRALAQFIFKRDAQGFTASEEDGTMARYHLENLNITHEARGAGR